MCAPYKLTDFSRAALGEYVSFAFIPVIFDGINTIIKQEKNSCKFIIGIIGIVLTHTITTIYTAFFAILYLLFNLENIKDKKKTLKIFILDILICFAFTAFYWIPIIESKIYGNFSIFNAESMGSTGADVFQNTNNIEDWFKNEISGNELIFSLGICQIIFLLLTIICYKDVDKETKGIYNSAIILSIISGIMCTKLFPWIYMSKFMTIIQFAWRCNEFLVFFCSIISAINFYVALKKSKIGQIIVLTIIIVMITSLGTIRMFNYKEKVLENEKISASESIEKDKEFERYLHNSKTFDPMQINREYLPLKANVKYINERPDMSLILNGFGSIESEEKNELSDKIYVKDANNLTIELPYIYYLGYSAKVNGKNILLSESKNGFLQIENLNGNDLEIEINYDGTNLEKIGYLITGISIIFTIFYGIKILTDKRKGKLLASGEEK